MAQDASEPSENRQAAGGSFEYRLQRAPVGVVLLDADLSIAALNPVAQRLLAPVDRDVIGANILDLHPEEARDKVAWLIARARTAPDGTASLVLATVMGHLVAKVSRLEGGTEGTVSGYCMMVHAFGEAPVMARAADGAPGRAAPAEAGPEVVAEALPLVDSKALPLTGAEAMKGLCPLLKLPLMRGKGGVISLIDVDEVVYLVAQGHYAEARARAFSAFCPRSLADLEQRLDPRVFHRVHRRYVVNIHHVRGAERVDGGWHLIMADDAATRVPVSRAKVEAVRRLLAV